MPPKRGIDSTNNDDEVQFDLGKKKKLTVRQFRGQMLVDIREFYSSQGKELPGKKGISLTMESWSALVDAIPQVQKALGNIDEGSVVKKPKVVDKETEKDTKKDRKEVKKAEIEESEEEEYNEGDDASEEE